MLYGWVLPERDEAAQQPLAMAGGSARGTIDMGPWRAGAGQGAWAQPRSATRADFFALATGFTYA